MRKGRRERGGGGRDITKTVTNVVGTYTASFLKDSYTLFY